MRKVNPDAKKAMKLMYSENISLAEAWKRVKGGSRSAKRSKRRLSKAKNSLKLNRKKMFKISRKNKRRSMKRSRKFGSEVGPGYSGSTSYSSAVAPYFGKSENYIPASEFWAPVSGGKPQYPEMLYKN